MRLSDQQKEHRAYITKQTSLRQHDKYSAGALEHGGVLKDKSLVWLAENVVDEAIDQTTYTLTILQKLQDLSIWSDDELIEFRDRIEVELERRSQAEMMEDL